MGKIDKVVLRETAYIAAWTIIFSALLQSVFLMIGKWELFVLLGNIYGSAAAVLNFFVMGLSVQKALTKDPKDVQAYIKASSTARLFVLFVITLIGVLIFRSAVLAVVIPLLFPRAAIMLRPFFGKRMDAANGYVPAVENSSTLNTEENGETDTENTTNETQTEGGADNE